jgi:hypothetical protein
MVDDLRDQDEDVLDASYLGQVDKQLAQELLDILKSRYAGDREEGFNEYEDFNEEDVQESDFDLNANSDSEDDVDNQHPRDQGDGDENDDDDVEETIKKQIKELRAQRNPGVALKSSMMGSTGVEEKQDWGNLLTGDEDDADPYEILAAMQDPHASAGGLGGLGELGGLLNSGILGGAPGIEDNPDALVKEALMESYNRVNLVLYKAQRQKYRLAMAVSKQLDGFVERFSKDGFSGDEDAEEVAIKPLQDLAYQTTERLLDIGQRASFDTLDEMRALKGTTIDGRTIESFNIFNKIKKGFQKLGNKIKKGFEELKNRFDGLIKKIGSAFKDVIKKIGNLGHYIVDAFNAIMKKILKPIANGFKKVIDTIILKPVNWIKNAARKIWRGIKDLGRKIARGITTAFNKVKNAFKEFGRKLKSGFQKAFAKIGKFFKAFAEGFVNFFKGLWNGIKKVFSTIWGFFKAIFTGVKWAFWFVINMVKAVPNFILNIGRFFFAFFKNILATVVFIGKLTADAAVNPFAVFFKIIALFAGIIVGFTLLIIYTILSWGPHYLAGLIFAWVCSWAIVIIIVTIYVLLAVLATLVFVVVWIVTLITGSALVFMLHCENTPDAWFNEPGYSLGNKFRRFLLCFRPCPGRWKSKAGVMCVRQTNSCPLFCPQQQIFGFFESPAERADRSDPVIYDGVVPDTAFWNKPIVKKRDAILDVLKEKKSFLGVCATSNKEYDFINKHVCANVNILDDSLYPPETKEKMRSLCKQAYCEWSVSKNLAGNPIATFTGSISSPLCRAIGRGGRTGSVRPVPRSALQEFLDCIYLLIAGTVVAFVVITVKGYMKVPPVAAAAD